VPGEIEAIRGSALNFFEDLGVKKMRKGEKEKTLGTVWEIPRAGYRGAVSVSCGLPTPLKVSKTKVIIEIDAAEFRGSSCRN
jgi:hypothetical protein